MGKFISTVVIAIALQGGAVMAQDNAGVRAEIEEVFGFVPGFVELLPADALPGAWAELKALEVSQTTALDAKVKALISIAVAAQIPCQFCVWIDTQSALVAGATDQEIREAVAMAAITRHWSTVFHGNMLDFDAFKQEFHALAEAAAEARAASSR